MNWASEMPRKTRRAAWTRYALMGICVPLLCVAYLRLFGKRAARIEHARVSEPPQRVDLALRHVADIYSSGQAKRSALEPPPARIAWVGHSSDKPGGNIYNYGPSIAQITCYCSQKNIPFFLELFDYQRHDVLQGPMTSRHYATEKHLKNFDWIIFADLDVYLADSRMDIRYFLDDSVDVILPDRDNGEICACAYIVRNSPGGFAFLRRWIQWGSGRKGMNTDNGDLLEMMMAGTARGGFGRSNGDSRQFALDTLNPRDQPCRNEDIGDSTNWPEAERRYRDDFLPTFMKAFEPLRNADPKAISWETTLWPASRAPSRVRVYKPFSGLIRTAGAEIEDWMLERTPYGYFAVPGDFLMHAKNAQSRISDELVRCSEPEWQIDYRIPLQLARKQLRGQWPNYWGCQFAENGTITYMCD